eukprot:TRINITY_DN14363_c0_g1_i1.p1 TRINITY_DN14363_c0_g1~~TRINITY_DN14363_c0_g1_i1.p1  ORF type:complete len:408 (+),score=71.87 TRINITY_DN14363_c0_g1_i1:36-1259(+)
MLANTFALDPALSSVRAPARASLPAQARGPQPVSTCTPHGPVAPEVSAAVAAAVVGFAAGWRRTARARPRMLMYCATQTMQDTMTENVRKLQESLAVAVEAEANGEDAAAVRQAETRAREVALFQGNGFKMFGAAAQIPKQPYSMQDIKDAKLDGNRLLTTDDTAVGMRNRLLSFVAIVGASLAFGFPGLRGAVLTIGIALFVAIAVDVLLGQGSWQLLILDVLARAVNPEYENRVVQHEAARFLVGYLIGVLPKGYSLSALDALEKFQSPSIKAGCLYCSADLQNEVTSGSLSSKTLDQLVCIKLAGVAQEYLMFGRAQSGSSNIVQVEDLFSALNFDPRRRTDQTNWAILNVASLLRRYKEVHVELAKAMQGGASVGECIAIIERVAPSCSEPEETEWPPQLDED